MKKKKAKDDKRDVELKVYMVYNEAQGTLNFSTMYPNTTKLWGEMLSNYYMYAVGLDLNASRPQDKVEIMEEMSRWWKQTSSSLFVN